MTDSCTFHVSGIGVELCEYLLLNIVVGDESFARNYPSAETLNAELAANLFSSLDELFVSLENTAVWRIIVKEMEIKVVGLRPGEKLYEELMMDEEQDKMRRTEHNKIFVAPPKDIDLARFYTQLQDLSAAAAHNDEGVVKQLAAMIPTFTPTRGNLKT